VVAHVAQETPSTDQLAIEYVLDGDAELPARGTLRGRGSRAQPVRASPHQQDFHRIGG
jgi:hypothetical protein